ncbi:MAG: hypothetical protein NT016_04010 [Candidatus Aenigmarchaeota archaeon]|nr:hypothetical protein [Candidatus Aenigmarchaeota archaeon]
MDETVYYSRIAKGHMYVPAEISVGGRAHILETSERVIVYLPERGLAADGVLDSLPIEYDMDEPDEGRRKILQLTKETLHGPTSSWIAYDITRIPSKAKELRIEKSKIDRFVRLFDLQEREFRGFAAELGAMGALEGEAFNVVKTEHDPLKYQNELNGLCEEIFLDEIRRSSRRKHLNTDNSIKTN